VIGFKKEMFPSYQVRAGYLFLFLASFLSLSSASKELLDVKLIRMVLDPCKPELGSWTCQIGSTANNSPLSVYRLGRLGLCGVFLQSSKGPVGGATSIGGLVQLVGRWNLHFHSSSGDDSCAQ
jgi:hypothetical protein